MSGPGRARPPGPPDVPPAAPRAEPEPILPAVVHAPHAHPLPPTRPLAPGRRPVLERIGMAAIAVIISAFFGLVGATSLERGELFLGTMAVVGAVMTAWVGLVSLLRG